jgi:hypothetical protein
MQTHIGLTFLLVAGACGAQANAPAAPRAQTASERLGPEREAPRLVATLDQAIGPGFSEDGERFTATVAPDSALPAGTKLVGRVIDVQPAMAGTMAYVVLGIGGVERGDGVEPLDARITAVELLEPQLGGREVNATGAPASEVIGSIVPPDKVPDSDAMDRDPLGRGTVISLGTGAQPHQLDKGTRLVIDAGDAGSHRQNVAGAEDVARLRDVRAGAGRAVRLDDVTVHSVIGDLVFWVGEDAAERTLVVLDPAIDEPERQTVIRPGMRLSIIGRAEKTPSAAEAPRLWKMVSRAEASELPGHPVYIRATRVKVR